MLTGKCGMICMLSYCMAPGLDLRYTDHAISHSAGWDLDDLDRDLFDVCMIYMTSVVYRGGSRP